MLDAIKNCINYSIVTFLVKLKELTSFDFEYTSYQGHATFIFLSPKCDAYSRVALI